MDWFTIFCYFFLFAGNNRSKLIIIRSESKFQNHWKEKWYSRTWIKTDAVSTKELKSWSIFITKLDRKCVHGRSEKTKNSIQCLKIMGIVQISWFHARIEWKKNWQHFGHITRYAAYKPEDLQRSFREMRSVWQDL